MGVRTRFPNGAFQVLDHHACSLPGASCTAIPQVVLRIPRPACLRRTRNQGDNSYEISRVSTERSLMMLAMFLFGRTDPAVPLCEKQEEHDVECIKHECSRTDEWTWRCTPMQPQQTSRLSNDICLNISHQRFVILRLRGTDRVSESKPAAVYMYKTRMKRLKRNRASRTPVSIRQLLRPLVVLCNWMIT